MLSHMRTKAEVDLAEAESAFTEAESAYQRSRTSVNAAQLEIAKKKKARQRKEFDWATKEKVAFGRERHGGDGQRGDTP